MKKFIKIIAFICAMCAVLCFAGCKTSGSRQDTLNTKAAANKLQENQPTPTDIEYSLERYNLIRRSYWVNGQREKQMLLCVRLKSRLVM